MGLGSRCLLQGNKQNVGVIRGLTIQAVIYSRDQHRGLAEMGKALPMSGYLTAVCCGLSEKREKAEGSSLKERSL